ncbi:hypothetical protein ACFB49_17250 [Sphingomonas sp. DBB INV C78]|uniref:nuclear transport factor 2 family protein n=1 Tax=Sphingomonas sp. DBB INV C78 TaxID=3349434 RepID=UPI0036D24405
MTTDLSIAELADIQAIRNRLAQHSRGIDRADFGLLADCYVEDGTVDYGFFAGSAHQFAAIIADAQRGQPVTLHRTSQMWVRLDGDRAISESYILAYAQSPEADGTVHQRLICGRYLDRHERRDGVWRMAHRHYLLDTNVNWPGAWAIAPLAPLALHLPAGGQGSADPGLALLALGRAINAKFTVGESGMRTDPPDAATVEAVLARQQIADLTMAYCRGVDRADEALLKTLFHEDSTIVSGTFNGSGQLFATEICKIVRAVFDQTFHSIANQWVEVTGDGAVGETYVIAVATMTEEDNAKSEILTGGRYVDRFEKRDGAWRFAERTFVIDWSIKQPSSRMIGQGMYEPLENGTFGPDDPVYRLWH